MRRACERVNQYLRILALVRDLQATSNARLKIVYFDSKQQHLTELDAEYEKSKERDNAAARDLIMRD